MEDLQTEVEFYRHNQTAVEEEIRTLIADNQKLSHQVGMLLKEKLENARQADTETCKGTESNELRRQVSMLSKERDSLHVLWQTSQKTIEALETELKAYQQSYDNRNHQNIAEENRDLELKLKESLVDYVELEHKYKELHTKYNRMESELKNKDKEVASYKERGKELEEQMNEVAQSVGEYKISLAVEKKANEEAKKQLTSMQKECADAVKRELEAKSKVAEALHLYDVVSVQKHEAHKTIQKLTGELSQVKEKLANVKRDVEISHRQEIDVIKEKYNEKVSDMLQHMRTLDSELVEKGLLLNKTLRDNKVLIAANESYLKQHEEQVKLIDPKLALAEQRIEAMFQELVTSERRNMQLVCEKQCLAIDIQRTQDNHARESKRRDWEESLLKTQCEELKTQVEHLQKSLKETHEMVNKLQNMLLSRAELSHKMVSSKEEELMALNKHLENQMELSRKWKESYLQMTDKLKKNMELLFKENKELRSQLKLPTIGSSRDDSTSASS